MDEAIAMEEDEASPVVKSIECQLSSHCECTTSFGSEHSADESLVDVIDEEDVGSTYRTRSVHIRSNEEVWYSHDENQEQANLGKCRTMKGRSRERGSSRRYEHRRDKIEIGRSFQLAVGSHDWNLAESLIPLADSQRLNDGLCITLDSVWFLCTHEELKGATSLIEKLVEAGAHDFTRAALRTSFLASCVSACRSRTMSLADTVTVMAQRLVFDKRLYCRLAFLLIIG